METKTQNNINTLTKCESYSLNKSFTNCDESGNFYSDYIRIDKNEKFGRFLVANSEIEAGELLIDESPLVVGPYIPNGIQNFCLACYKDLKNDENCKKCSWPICSNNEICQKVI